MSIIKFAEEPISKYRNQNRTKSPFILPLQSTYLNPFATQ